MSPKQRSRVDYWQDPKAPKPTSRKPSASVLVHDNAGRVLLQRPDNGLWTIPTGAVKKGRDRAGGSRAGVPEGDGPAGRGHWPGRCVLDPGPPDRLPEGRQGQGVRQPVNVCLHARPVAGELATTKEATQVVWVQSADLEGYEIHPAIRLRIQHGLSYNEPYIG
jgi:hypothetical protein